MHSLTKKTTILLSPELYSQLRQVSRMTHKPVAELIRQAVIERYMLSSSKDRTAAVNSLAEMKTPIGRWQDLEKDIINGRLNDIA